MTIWRSAAFRQPSTLAHARAFSLYVSYKYLFKACYRPHLIGDVIHVLVFRSTAERQLTGHWFLSVCRSTYEDEHY